MRTKWFAIRADSSAQIGIGHGMRCLAFAERAVERGYKFVFLARFISPLVESKVAELRGHLVKLDAGDGYVDCTYAHSSWLDASESLDSVQSISALNKETEDLGSKPNFILVDHYALAAPWEIKLSKMCPVVAVDDLNDRSHYCDILIDQTHGKELIDYKGLLPARTKALLGAKYSMLRKEFTQLVPLSESSKQVETGVLLSLGGVDKENMTLRVLKCLEQSEYRAALTLHVVTSSANPNIDSLRCFIDSSSHSDVLLIDENNMGRLMSKMAVSIGAPGSSTWERCASGLPFMSIPIAANQRQILEVFQREGMTVNVLDNDELNIQKIDDYFDLVINRTAELARLKERLKSVCDGKGAERVLDEIELLISGSIRKVDIENV